MHYDKPRQHIKNQRLTLQTKICIVKAMIFQYSYKCACWIKKAEHCRNDAFKLWFWRRLLRVPWTAKRSSQSILKEINPEYSLEGLMLKLQHFGHLMQKANSLVKTLILGKEEKEATENEMVGWHHQWTWVWENSGGQWRTGKPAILQPMGSQRVRQSLMAEQQQQLPSGNLMKLKKREVRLLWRDHFWHPTLFMPSAPLSSY